MLENNHVQLIPRIHLTASPKAYRIRIEGSCSQSVIGLVAPLAPTADCQRLEAHPEHAPQAVELLTQMSYGNLVGDFARKRAPPTCVHVELPQDTVRVRGRQEDTVLVASSRCRLQCSDHQMCLLLTTLVLPKFRAHLPKES